MTIYNYCSCSGLRLYICQACGKSHRWKDEMQKCENTHAGIFKFPCHHDKCTKKFQTRLRIIENKAYFNVDIYRFRLDLHLRTHDGRRPFQCPGCVYTCARKDNLSTHVKKVHKMGLEESKLIFKRDYNVHSSSICDKIVN